MPINDKGYVRVMRIKNANGEERTLQFPMRLDLERPKRARTTFSEQQLRELDAAYRANGYLTGDRRVTLAEALGLTDTQVKVWFQNRRTKDRKRKPGDDNVLVSSPSPTQPLSCYREQTADSSQSNSHKISSSLTFLPEPQIMTHPFFQPFSPNFTRNAVLNLQMPTFPSHFFFENPLLPFMLHN